MTVLDVGQGLAVVVETHRHALVYDTGPRYSDEADAGGRLVAPFLRAEGIERLAAHDRHAPGQRPQRRRADVACDGARGRFVSSLPADHAILARRAADGGVAERCEAGQAWTWDGVRFTVLQPTPRSTRSPQTSRTTSRASCASTPTTAARSLTGDLEARGELELVRSDPECAQGGRAARAASRQPHVVDAGVHRGGGAPDRGVHAGLPQPVRPSASGGRRALRPRGHPGLPDGSRRRAHVHVRAGSIARASRRARARPEVLVRRAGARGDEAASSDGRRMPARSPRSSAGANPSSARGVSHRSLRRSDASGKSVSTRFSSTP